MNLNKRSLKSVSVLLTVGLILFTPAMSFGWGAGGHMMTAKIAFGRLTPRAKTEVTRLLAIPVKVKLPNGTTPKLSPEDKKKLTGYNAQSKDFVNAAHWADDLKGIKAFDPFKELHFKDVYFSDDGSQLPTEAANNIVTELTRDVDILKNSTDDNARAQALRFIIHFVGDIHQPLHCAARVVHGKGDQGGNLVKLTIAKNLHSYWDGGLQTFPKEGPPPNFKAPPLAMVTAAARKIAAANPDNASGLNLNDPTNFESWVQESFKLARQDAYDGVPAGSTFDPSNDYKKQGIKDAEQRVAWGGYRLAALLNSIWP
ncbi:MAG TPA: S1/P1 nuclease [Pyrinomonadaceae bacterium]|nr:S1/P1 nuclease [Pyrinomonadaceae bacterium]